MSRAGHPGRWPRLRPGSDSGLWKGADPQDRIPADRATGPVIRRRHRMLRNSADCRARRSCPRASGTHTDAAAGGSIRLGAACAERGTLIGETAGRSRNAPGQCGSAAAARARPRGLAPGRRQGRRSSVPLAAAASGPDRRARPVAALPAMNRRSRIATEPRPRRKMADDRRTISRLLNCRELWRTPANSRTQSPRSSMRRSDEQQTYATCGP